jgi:hypothetical protein
LKFTAGSGTQYFIPKADSIHPRIQLAGTGTVKLVTNSLKATGQQKYDAIIAACQRPIAR